MKSFVELGVSPELVKGLNELNIINPTEIQSKVIPVLLQEGGDIVQESVRGGTYGLIIREQCTPFFAGCFGFLIGFLSHHAENHIKNNVF